MLNMIEMTPAEFLSDEDLVMEKARVLAVLEKDPHDDWYNERLAEIELAEANRE